MRYPDWFRAQVVQAVLLHGVTYARVARLYGVTDDTVRGWVNAATDMPTGFDRIETLEHRVARIEHYLALAAEIRVQGEGGSWPAHPAARRNAHSVIEPVDGCDAGRTTGS